MTLSQRAIEAAARAIYENWANYPACDQSKPWEFICEERNPQADDFRRKAKAALTAALAVDGLCLVPKEPTAKMIAAAFPTEGERPPPDDMKIGAEAILVLEGGDDFGSITGLAVIEAASMCKDYRKMIAAASTGGSTRKTEG